MEKRLFVSVPLKMWGLYKRNILTTFFEGTPTLVRHPELSDGEREYSTFYAELQSDIDKAMTKVPVGGVSVLVEDLYS